LNFIAFYDVLLEFEKRMSVNMQEINSKPWIMGLIMEGAKEGLSNKNFEERSKASEECGGESNR